MFRAGIISIAILFLLAIPITAQTKQPKSNRANSTKKALPPPAPVIETLNFDDYEVCIVCRLSSRSLEDEKPEIVQVTVGAKNVPEDFVYYYAVTGGKIVGTGPSVKWDLQGMLPGEYTLSVGAGNNNVISSNVYSKRVTVKVCGCCLVPCDCGTLEMEGPTKAARPGETVLLRARVTGGPTVGYKWTVSAGTILGDPNGPSIMVKVPNDLKDANITATVELTGTDPNCGCPTIDDLTFGIDK